MLTMPIRTKNEISLMKAHFLSCNEYRNYALFVTGINTALRISDLLQLKWQDVYDFKAQCFRTHIWIVEQKTEKHSCIMINSTCKDALLLLMEKMAPQSENEYIFYSGKDRFHHISRNRAYHIIKKAADAENLEGNISCHSLRKTFGYHAWRNGTPPALIMNIYNHSNIEITKRYLSIDQDDRDEVFAKLNL